MLCFSSGSLSSSSRSQCAAAGAAQLGDSAAHDALRVERAYCRPPSEPVTGTVAAVARGCCPEDARVIRRRDLRARRATGGGDPGPDHRSRAQRRGHPDGHRSLIVLRGAKQNYSFTLGLPVSIEPEDVPEEVAAAAFGAAHLYGVLVEGSSATETPHALKFARRLADASSSVVLNQQTGQIWSRGKLRQAPRVETGVVSTVEVRWYTHTAADAGKAAEAWLILARRHLPEALPRGYGTRHAATPTAAHRSRPGRGRRNSTTGGTRTRV
jgi:hypothetical protein